uniref:DM2 domain-containing protein n=1 Tax=Xiphophorus couchianus TaxID=32473 RepID=A0A3B5M1J8_9TELE
PTKEQEEKGTLLKPVPRMLPLLQSVGAEGDTFTVEQVFHYVEQYIKRRRLYDEERQYLVRSIWLQLLLLSFLYSLHVE